MNIQINLEILKEGGYLSFTRVLSLVAFVFFIIVTAYLVLQGETWGHYETFAYMTCGGALGLQGFNKHVNSKFNTPLGDTGKKVER